MTIRILCELTAEETVAIQNAADAMTRIFKWSELKSTGVVCGEPMQPDDYSADALVAAMADPERHIKPQRANYATVRLTEQCMNNIHQVMQDMQVAGVGIRACYPSGAFHYPAGGGQAWHTNQRADLHAAKRDMRLYIVWNATDGNTFLYSDPETGRIVEVSETKGWQAHVFDVSDQLWHAVRADQCQRLSIGIGFTLERKR